MKQGEDYKTNQHSKTQKNNIISSPDKGEIENKKQKKKKNAAFQSFLTKSQPPAMVDISTPKKAASGDNLQYQLIQQLRVCKICLKQNDQKSKLCQFCKDTLCGNHFRKKRINHDKNKYCRICDNCQDKYLMQKHYRNEMKTQQSLISQELILFSKHKEEKQILQSKKVKLQILLNKKTQMEDFIKKQRNRITALELDIQKKLLKLGASVDDNIKLQATLNEIQVSLPPSFQQDFSVLQQQNRKITKQLVKYEKMCLDAIKARCNKQKQMYEQYYEWQMSQKDLINEQQKKKQQCIIY